MKAILLFITFNCALLDALLMADWILRREALLAFCAGAMLALAIVVICLISLIPRHRL